MAYTLPKQIDGRKIADVMMRTERIAGRIDVVLDTDTYNEIDDQYAIAYLLASQSNVNIQAILAAPFANHHAATTQEGMEKSYEEILRVLELTKHSHMNSLVHRGAPVFLSDEMNPIDSPAAREIVRLSMEHTPENPLYVVCIAAPTNVSSAIRLEPRIVENIVVVWSGGVALDWPDCVCFNGGKDIAASRVLLQSEVPLVLTPGRGMADRFITTGPELEYWLKGKNDFCNYIVERSIREAEECYHHVGEPWSRAIVDVVPAAWAVGGDFMLDRFEVRPTIEYDLYYSFDPRRPLMRYVYYVKRDDLIRDMFTKLAGLP